MKTGQRKHIIMWCLLQERMHIAQVLTSASMKPIDT
jgi:hypothetical protein